VHVRTSSDDYFCQFEGLPTLKSFFSFVDAEADGALDKARKHKKRQLEDTYNLIVKKRKVFWFQKSRLHTLDSAFFNI
jgi:hypothetical protein